MGRQESQAPQRRHTHAPLTLEEHRALVEALGQRLAPVRVDLADTGPEADAGRAGARAVAALGCVLAESVSAQLPVPPFTNSAMDGFAVRQADLGSCAQGGDVDASVRLPVAGDVPAGARADVKLPAGCAMRIMTGAPIPEGADTVVRVEDTDHAPGVREVPAAVTIRGPQKSGANIRRRGEDVCPGAPVLSAGSVVTASALAAAVSVGAREVSVYPRPRVAILTTGAELQAPGQDLEPGQIPDSNGMLLDALVREAGAVPVVRARTPDDPDVLLEVLASLPEVDLVLTAGGISQGAYEVVRQACEAQGGVGAADATPVAADGQDATPVVAGGQGITSAGGNVPTSRLREDCAGGAQASTSPAQAVSSPARGDRAQEDEPSAGYKMVDCEELAHSSARRGADTWHSTVRFHHVAQQPGGPQGVGTIRLRGRDVPVMCLPGNPVSVFVSFHVHVAGLIRMMSGRSSGVAPRCIPVTADADWASPPTKVQFTPVSLVPVACACAKPAMCDDTPGKGLAPETGAASSAITQAMVRPVHRLGSGSHLAASLALADGLAVVPVGKDRVRAGDELFFIPTSDAAWAALAR